MSSRRGSAPGRLDLLGGVADYSGALVLEMPTRLATTVVAEPADALVVGPVHARPSTRWRRSRGSPTPRSAPRSPTSRVDPLRASASPSVLVRHGVIEPPRARLVGVVRRARSRSACRRAPRSRSRPPGRSAPTASTRSGSPRCARRPRTTWSARPAGSWTRSPSPWARRARSSRSSAGPASVRPRGACSPDDIEVVGWPTGAEHDVERRALPPGPRRRVHGQAHRRGRPRAARGRGSASCPPTPSTTCPRRSTARRSSTAGAAPTTTSPPSTRPRRTRSGRPRASASRSTPAASSASAHLGRGDVAALGPLMAASHAGYDAMGLGHPAATAAVEAALARPGVHGARSSGGGCGGTVVVVCDRGALDDVDALIR